MPVFRAWHEEHHQPLANIERYTKYTHEGKLYYVGEAIYKIRSGRLGIPSTLVGPLRAMGMSWHIEAVFENAAKVVYDREKTLNLSKDHTEPFEPDREYILHEYNQDIELGEWLSKVADGTWHVATTTQATLELREWRPRVPLSSWWPEIVAYMEGRAYLSTRDMAARGPHAQIRRYLRKILTGYTFVDAATRAGLAEYGFFMHTWQDYADALRIHLATAENASLKNLTDGVIVDIPINAPRKPQYYFGRVALKQGLDYIAQHPDRVLREDPRTWIALRDLGVFGTAGAVGPVPWSRPDVVPVAGPSRLAGDTEFPDHHAGEPSGNTADDFGDDGNHGAVPGFGLGDPGGQALMDDIDFGLG
ncbi:hypothetical protein ABT215_44900, partial [Streptomyces sp900105755]|uniref:hypothetical protein n=1 Tax=Streptomyces sp. 900105755 TaxID=3154389 RepID=UPI003332D7D0